MAKTKTTVTELATSKILLLKVSTDSSKHKRNKAKIRAVLEGKNFTVAKLPVSTTKWSGPPNCRRYWSCDTYHFKPNLAEKTPKRVLI